jgi:hypothetical protein
MDLRLKDIARITAENTKAAHAHVESHASDVEKVLACFGMMDQLNASQIHTFCGVRAYTVECMVETGHLTHVGYRAGSPTYTL